MQEATAAKVPDRSVVWYGHAEASWEYFTSTAVCVYQAIVQMGFEKYGPIYNHSIQNLFTIRLARQEVLRWKISVKLDLINLLFLVRFYETSDPRDKIYSLLAIANDGHDLALPADYNKPVVEVYKELAFRFIKRDSSLDIICLAGLCHKVHALPSWVPDWTFTTFPTSLYKLQSHSVFGTRTRMYNTNKGYLEEAKFSRGGYVLHIKGFVFDVVATGSKSRVETAMSQSELARN